MTRISALLVGFSIAATLGFAAPALAGSTIHIGSGAGTACATGGCPLYNGETNNFGTTGLDIYQNSNGAPDLLSQVLLILAIPNDTATGSLKVAGASTITGASLIAPYPGGTPDSISAIFGSTSFGLNGNGFEGLMTSGDIYSFLGLPGNNSNNMPNLTGWDSAVDGITATDFGIYVYGFDTTGFGGQDLINVGLTNLPEGTFAVAFGEDSKGKVYDTPFTEAGLRDVPPPLQTPEPMTIALFGAGLAGVAAMRRRKKKAA